MLNQPYVSIDTNNMHAAESSRMPGHSGTFLPILDLLVLDVDGRYIHPVDLVNRRSDAQLVHSGPFRTTDDVIHFLEQSANQEGSRESDIVAPTAERPNGLFTSVQKLPIARQPSPHI